MMADKRRLTDEIEQISLHNPRPLILHGYVAPFIVLYLVWLYIWVSIYGVHDYYEVGCIGFAVIGLLQVLACLFCHWFMEVRCLLTCSKVRKYDSALLLLLVWPSSIGTLGYLDAYRASVNVCYRVNISVLNC